MSFKYKLKINQKQYSGASPEWFNRLCMLGIVTALGFGLGLTGATIYSTFASPQQDTAPAQNQN